VRGAASSYCTSTLHNTVRQNHAIPVRIKIYMGIHEASERGPGTYVGTACCPKKRGVQNVVRRAEWSKLVAHPSLFATDPESSVPRRQVRPGNRRCYYPRPLGPAPPRACRR